MVVCSWCGMIVETERHRLFWGISSVGRATALHAVGQRFDSVILHAAYAVDSFFIMGVTVA